MHSIYAFTLSHEVKSHTYQNVSDTCNHPIREDGYMYWIDVIPPHVKGCVTIFVIKARMG